MFSVVILFGEYQVPVAVAWGSTGMVIAARRPRGKAITPSR